jgi:hypothetical protein
MFSKQNKRLLQKRVWILLLACFASFYFSCKEAPRKIKPPDNPVYTADTTGQRLTEKEIREAVLPNTFFFYALSKKYDASGSYTLTIFSAAHARIAFNQDVEAGIYVGHATYYMWVKLTADGICLTDHDGLYGGENKGKTRCYSVYRSGPDFKLFDRNPDVYTKRTGFYKNHGGDVGFLLSKKEITSFRDSL